MAQTLAPVYLEGSRVVLQGDPRPKVSKILSAGGRQGSSLRVLRLRSQEATEGERLGPDDVIDRTATQAPVYLKCVDRADPSTAASGRKPPNSSSDFGEQHGATLGSDQSDLGQGSGVLQEASNGAVSGGDREGPSGAGTGAFPNERPLEGEGGGSGSVLQGRQGSRKARDDGFGASGSGRTSSR